MDFDLKIKNKINKLFFSIRFINLNKDSYKKSLSNLYRLKKEIPSKMN